MDLPTDLRDALETALAGAPSGPLGAAVEKLITRYRAGGAADAPILTGRVDVLAYAAYRMPATYAAVRSALGQVALAAPGLRPARLVDLGGGTGAAAWAALDTFPDLADVTVVDRVEAALDLGRQLGAVRPPLRAAAWTSAVWPFPVPPADLVTVSYVLGELGEEDQAALVTAATAAVTAGPGGDRSGSGGVVIIEPGTPAGHARVLAARDRLLAAGLRVVAPCPHQSPCPLTRGDWCHAAARVNRSARHRRLKGGELGYEDEKFSYVAAVAPPLAGPPRDRVVRPPAVRKGLVAFRVCTVDGEERSVVVSKRDGDRYRAARDTRWGDQLV